MFRRLSNGFTILELVAVVVVLGILTLVSYANYKKQLHYNHVALVKAYLLDISNRQDNHLRQHRVYAKDLQQLGMTPNKILDSHYKVVIDVQNTPSFAGYTVKAIPKTESGDASTGNFTLNHLGQTSDNWGR